MLLTVTLITGAIALWILVLLLVLAIGVKAGERAALKAASDTVREAITDLRKKAREIPLYQGERTRLLQVASEGSIVALEETAAWMDRAAAR